ncbi:hypothetical protein [Dickeya fangzhongdai]|uniref:hypothetical protein n=1 Tax=Dickeya fangzhongdai TaxID=1778540 RepID=UPI0023E40D1B|nr:hypothetical protein [Dickeya fangzhongdai]WES88087.1 hypothetical protein PQ617_17930 [Dickeya fangzhongdai]
MGKIVISIEQKSEDILANGMMDVDIAITTTTEAAKNDNALVLLMMCLIHEGLPALTRSANAQLLNQVQSVKLVTETGTETDRKNYH